MKRIILISLILVGSACTFTVPKLQVYSEPDYPSINVQKEIHDKKMTDSDVYCISKETLIKLTKKNAQRRNFILKLQAQISAINNQ